MLVLLIRLYVTYIKTNLETGEVYVGMASALVEDDSEESAEKVLARREKAPHHKNKEGFGEADLESISTNRDAIRGREQLLYEKFKKDGIITAQNQPVSNRNPKKAFIFKRLSKLLGKF